MLQASMCDLLVVSWAVNTCPLHAGVIRACNTQTRTATRRVDLSVDRFVLDVVLGRVLIDERIDDRHAFTVRCVDAHERLPLLRQRVLREDRLDGALGLARTAVDALFR